VAGQARPYKIKLAEMPREAEYNDVRDFINKVNKNFLYRIEGPRLCYDLTAEAEVYVADIVALNLICDGLNGLPLPDSKQPVSVFEVVEGGPPEMMPTTIPSYRGLGGDADQIRKGAASDVSPAQPPIDSHQADPTPLRSYQCVPMAPEDREKFYRFCRDPQKINSKAGKLWLSRRPVSRDQELFDACDDHAARVLAQGAVRVPPLTPEERRPYEMNPQLMRNHVSDLRKQIAVA